MTREQAVFALLYILFAAFLAITLCAFAGGLAIIGVVSTISAMILCALLLRARHKAGEWRGPSGEEAAELAETNAFGLPPINITDGMDSVDYVHCLRAGIDPHSDEARAYLAGQRERAESERREGQ